MADFKTSERTIHKPVLLPEVLSFLDPKPGQTFLDGTFGGGGHSLAILAKVGPKGRVIGLDLDPEAIERFYASRPGMKKIKNLILIKDNYKHLKQISHELPVVQFDGVLLDLGLSSDQLSGEDRGFSFQSQGPVDLRYDRQKQTLTGEEILNNYSEAELFQIFKDYGEEPLARPIAKKIIAYRRDGQRFETAAMLVRLVSEEYRKRFKSRSLKNPATRVFQALRIAVNDEFHNLRAVLPDALQILSPGGRLAVISFHSGEDRIVKNFFRDQAKAAWPGEPAKIKILTKKPVIASEKEKQENSRSRSAKLRVAEKI